MSGYIDPGDKTQGTDDHSIESVLHSIRRVMAEEQDPHAAPGAPADDEPFMLDRSMLVSPPPGVVPPRAPDAPGHQPLQHERETRREAAPASRDALMADATLEATERSIEALQQALSRHERKRTIASDTPVRANGLTIEDMVREEVRGMVRTWLDAHLPSLVEIMVRAEISKMSGR